MANNIAEASELRRKYQRFRILVIGRANAGKTTLLKRVCNAKEDEKAHIYDEETKSLLEELEPTQDRGEHDIRRPFAFESNQQFIFHDSPGFETGDETQLKDVQKFIDERAKATDVEYQIHAIWFCLVTNASRPLLDLEKKFFVEKCYGNVPLIAIFTKYDDFINQVSKSRMSLKDKYATGEAELKKRFEEPLLSYKFPHEAMLRLKDMHSDDGNHQEQVKELIQKTADSLDDLALKMLFVSVQQNNLELCIKYAVKHAHISTNIEKMVQQCLQWFCHSYYEFYDYGKTEEDDLRFEFRDFRQLKKNTQAVISIIGTSLFSSQVALFAAFVICVENSFWSMSKSQSLPFNKAFQAAWESFLADVKKEHLQTTLDGIYHETLTGKDEERLTEIILAHQLSLPTKEEPSGSSAAQ